MIRGKPNRDAVAHDLSGSMDDSGLSSDAVGEPVRTPDASSKGDDVADMGDMASANENTPRPVATDFDAEPMKLEREKKPRRRLTPGMLANNAANAAENAGETVGGLAGMAAQGLKNLPQTASQWAGRALGPVGDVFTRMSAAVSDRLGVGAGVGRGLTAGVLVLALAGVGTGAVALGSSGFNQQLWTDYYDECVYAYADEGKSRYGSAENVIPETLNGHPLGNEYTVCVNLDTYTYPTGSVQRYWQDKWIEGGREITNGCPTVDGRYLVATTDKYGAMGDQIDFYLDDGTLIPCIRAEAKAEEVAPWDPNPANEWGHKDGRCILEFQWCNGSGYDQYGTNPGQNYFEELKGHRVAGWTNLGSGMEGGSIISGATGATGSAANKNAMASMDECGQRATFADNSTAAAAMVSYSYSHRATYGDNHEGTELWFKVFEEIFPGDGYPRSCDRGVATALHWSGTDINFPVGDTSTQYNYCLDHPEKWEVVSTDGAAAEAAGELQPGDVAIVTNGGHIRMYVGNEIAQQVYESTIKGTDGDLGPIDESYVWAEASIGTGNTSFAPDARAPCLSNWTCADDGRPYTIFRCINPDNSDKYDGIEIAGVTSSNSASIEACECRIVEPEQSPGDEIAELAVYMAATASPEERIRGVQNDPWEDNDDPRIDNLVTIMDATLGSWGGNNAYASCCQATCGVVAAAADPDIAPSRWPENGSGSGLPPGPIPDVPWEEGMGGSGGPNATEWYLTQRSEIWEKVGEDMSLDDLEPGDVLVSNTHVMIYVGEEAARKRFPGTDANIYEASYADGVGGDGTCFYAGLTRRDNVDGFRVFRCKHVNENAAHDTLNWQSMVKK